MGTAAGSRIGPYRLERALGSGGMGEVWLASLEENVSGLDRGTRYALKLVHPHLLGSQGFFKRFLREADLGRQVRHENVVRTFDVDATEHDGRTVHYLVMEYVEGRTLRAVLSELTTFPESLLRAIASQIASGLEAIHALGIVHRDLKPENVLVTQDHQVRIMDLGVARLQEATIAITREGQFAGSLCYAAPEQFRGGDVGPASDLYSLGVVLQELATGENPFQHDQAAAVIDAHLNRTPPSVRERNSEISAFVSEIVASLLAKKPGERFGSAKELREVLAEGERSAWWSAREGAVRARDARLPRIRVARDTELKGREAELALLTDAWKRAKDGHGSVLLIEGEAGIGKTRLVDAFVTTLAGDDAHILFGDYPPSGGLGGLSDAILGKFGAANLAESLTPYLAETKALVPAFAALLRHEAPPPGAEPVRGDALLAVFRGLLRALAAEKPTLWITDDVQFAPAESRQALVAMARAIADTRAVILMTSRPGLPEDDVAHFGRLSHFHRVPLGRLSPRQVVELLRAAFKSDTLADKLGAKIAYKSDGVPYFVFEMIRALEEGRLLRKTGDGTWVQTEVISDIEVPSAVRDLVEGRLKELSDDDRSLLDVAAVNGFEFDPDLVARVLEMKPIKVLQRLASIERKTGVVRGEGATCRFDHHHLQEVLYESLLPGLRTEYHSALVDARIERDGLAATDADDVPGDTALFLARHGLAGTRPRDVARFVRPALTHLSAANRSELAIEVADRALAVKGVLVGAELVEVLLARAEMPDVNHKPRAVELAQRAVDATTASGDAKLRAKAVRALGHAYEFVDKELALTKLDEARDLARAAGDRVTEVRALSCRTVALWNLGRREEAIAGNPEIVAIARGVAELHGGVTSLANGCEFEVLSARPGAGLTLGRQALAAATADGSLRARCFAGSRIAAALAILGDTDAALAASVAAAEIAGELVETNTLVGSLAVAASCAARRSDRAAAWSYAERVIAAAEESGIDRYLDDALLEAADVAAQLGRGSDAVRFADRAVAIAKSGGDADAIVLGSCLRATLPGGDAAAAAAVFAANEPKLLPYERFRARALLFRATRDPVHLDAAWPILEAMREDAPPEYKETIISNVPLHREVAEAWKARGRT